MATSNPVGLVYDPRYHTFNSWASLMCELYAAQQLSIPTDSTDWHQWGNGLLAIDVFANEGFECCEVFDMTCHAFSVAQQEGPIG